MKMNYPFATWLRAAGTISILLCHYVQQSRSSVLNLSSQFFNIGVEIFIILSGFLFGVGEGKLNTKAWYLKRAKRIFIPYELFVLILFVVHAVGGIKLWDVDWIWLVLGMQGSVVGVWGAEQTWFITPLLLCYAITPLLSRYISKEITKAKAIVIVCIAAGIRLLWAIPKSPAYNTLLSLVSYYIIAFAVGRFFDQLTFSKEKTALAFLLMCMAFGIRFAGCFFFDGTVLYERIICGYTQSIAAFCIFYIFAVIFQNAPPSKWVQFISEISFEIYLYHYMFCVGPIRLFGVTNSWIMNCVIIFFITMIIAVVTNMISRYIIKAYLLIDTCIF